MFNELKGSVVMASKADEGAGCVLMIGLIMMVIGSLYLWGPVSLIVIGGLITALVIMGS